MSKSWDDLIFKPVRFPLEEEVADERDKHGERKVETSKKKEKRD